MGLTPDPTSTLAVDVVAIDEPMLRVLDADGLVGALGRIDGIRSLRRAGARPRKASLK